jgi:hypothetical protein
MSDDRDDSPHDSGSRREYASLDAAFEDKKIPMENRGFIRSFLDALPIAAYHEASSHIAATRTDSPHPMHVSYGYTTGFRSEQEVLDVVGDVERWRSGSRKKVWGVAHPVNKIRAGGESTAAADARPVAHCPTCGLQLPSAGGTCVYCD